MKLSLVVLIAFWAMSFQQVFAQNYLATNDADTPHLTNIPTEVQDYYEQLIAQYGQSERYRASELALQAYACNKEEFCAKLHLILADEAILMQNFEEAKAHLEEVVATDFVPNRYTEGLVAEQSKLKALAGLRNIAMAEGDFLTALDLHIRYVDSLELNWRELAERNQLDNDKIKATCYQSLGKSEQAIACLAPYAFGLAGEFYGTIDKEAIDYLTELLRTKYPKKEYKRLLSMVGKQIYTEEKGGKVLFFLQVFENKIYFENDSANFEWRAAADANLIGEGVAHYQRKLLNSYFYQSLVK